MLSLFRQSVSWGTERSGVTVTNWQDFGGWGGGCGLACRSCLVAILAQERSCAQF